MRHREPPSRRQVNPVNRGGMGSDSNAKAIIAEKNRKKNESKKRNESVRACCSPACNGARMLPKCGLSARARASVIQALQCFLPGHKPPGQELLLAGRDMP